MKALTTMMMAMPDSFVVCLRSEHSGERTGNS